MRNSNSGPRNLPIHLPKDVVGFKKFVATLYVELENEGLRGEDRLVEVNDAIAKRYPGTPDCQFRDTRHLSDQVKHYLKDVAGKSISEIRKSVSEEASGLTQLNDLLGESDRPETTTGKDGKKYYVFQITQTDPTTGSEYQVPVSILVETVDAICEDYVRHGRNMSQQEVVDKYGITGKAWNVLKSRLNLNKLSNAISEETLKDADAAGTLAETINKSSERHFGIKVKELYKKAHENIQKREVKQAFIRLGGVDAQLEEIRKAIEGYKPVKVSFSKPAAIAAKDRIRRAVQIFLSDIHLGRKNTDEILENLKVIKKEIIDMPEEEVNLMFLGDLVEAIVQDGFHAGMTLGMDMEKWGTGFNLILKVSDTLAQWVSEIAHHKKKVVVWCLTGNHGRMTKNKEEDHERTGELVIYELMKRAVSLQKNVEVKLLTDKITAIDIGNIRYIIGHGDGRIFDVQNPANIILKHGDNRKFNVIVSGDKHNLKLQDVEHLGLWIKTRALAGRGHYEKENDYNGTNGYLVVRENEFKKADVRINSV